MNVIKRPSSLYEWICIIFLESVSYHDTDDTIKQIDIEECKENEDHDTVK